jgi:hypothetical protein
VTCEAFLTISANSASCRRGNCLLSPTELFTNSCLKGSWLLDMLTYGQPLRRQPMVREALTALALVVFVSGILGVLIYLGADALMEFVFL